MHIAQFKQDTYNETEGVALKGGVPKCLNVYQHIATKPQYKVLYIQHNQI